MSATGFNTEVVKPLERGQLVPGPRAKITRTRIGQTISMGRESKWRHPWWTQLIWDGGLQQWVATIKPGFVNGRAPVYRETIKDAQSSPQYGINPLSGEQWFSADVFKNPSQNPDTTYLSTPLYFNPAIKLQLQNVGWDGPGTAVPVFFQAKGVNASPSQDQLMAAIVNGGNPSDVPPKGNRLLRSCDLVLHQPRAGLNAVTTVPGEVALATGQSIASTQLTLSSPASGDELQILPMQAWALPVNGIDPVTGDYVEQTWDEVLISTVFLLSAPDALPGSAVDATWTPYVRHSLFWNLNYAQPIFRTVAANIGVSLGAAALLAGGAGAMLINFATAALNDAITAAGNVVRGNSMAGTFWTPTCGGSQSYFPAVVPATPTGKTGLDKNGRLLAQRQAVIAQQTVAPLDPVFPYSCPPFNTDLLK